MDFIFGLSFRKLDTVSIFSDRIKPILDVFDCFVVYTYSIQYLIKMFNQKLYRFVCCQYFIKSQDNKSIFGEIFHNS